MSPIGFFRPICYQSSSFTVGSHYKEGNHSEFNSSNSPQSRLVFFWEFYSEPFFYTPIALPQFAILAVIELAALDYIPFQDLLTTFSTLRSSAHLSSKQNYPHNISLPPINFTKTSLLFEYNLSRNHWWELGNKENHVVYPSISLSLYRIHCLLIFPAQVKPFPVHPCSCISHFNNKAHINPPFHNHTPIILSPHSIFQNHIHISFGYEYKLKMILRHNRHNLGISKIQSDILWFFVLRNWPMILKTFLSLEQYLGEFDNTKSLSSSSGADFGSVGFDGIYFGSDRFLIWVRQCDRALIPC